MDRTRHTLIFPVAALDLLVDVLLYVALQDSCSGGFVELGCFQYMCCVDPIVVSPSHDMLLQVRAKLKLVHGNLVQLSALCLGVLSTA